MQQRRWPGLTVTRLETRAGEVRLTASEHVLGLHAGRAVQARCRLEGQSQVRLQSRGDIALVPAGASGAWHDDRTSQMVVLTVSPALVQTAARGLGLDGERVELTPRLVVRDPQLQHLGWALEAELDGDATDDLYGESLAMALAVQLVRRHRVSGPAAERTPRGLSAAQLARVNEAIEASLTVPPTLAGLADVAGVSVSHFQVLFRRSTGQSVHRYVVRQRVEHARQLLVTGASISDAAARTGFCDASHLARWLRRLHGVTPSKLRA